MATMFMTMAAGIKSAFAAGTAAMSGAGAAAGAAGATGAAAGGLGMLSTAATVVGGLSSIMSARQNAAAAGAQAAQEEVAATQELLKGREDALQAMRSMNDDQARIAVAGYASGIGGEGSVQAAQDEAARIGEQNMNMSRINASYQAAGRRTQADQYRSEGRSAMWGGFLGAAKGALQLYERRAYRG